MKEVFAITQKCGDELVEFPHVLFGVDKEALRSSTNQTNARSKITWNREIWGLLCEDETYEFIEKSSMFGGFDPYEIEAHREVFMKLMANMHFYKEVQMI